MLTAYNAQIFQFVTEPPQDLIHNNESSTLIKSPNLVAEDEVPKESVKPVAPIIDSGSKTNYVAGRHNQAFDDWVMSTVAQQGGGSLSWAFNTNVRQMAVISPYYMASAPNFIFDFDVNTNAGAHPIFSQMFHYFTRVRWKKFRYRIEMETQPLCYGAMCAVVLPFDSQQYSFSETFTDSTTAMFDIGSLMNYNPLIWNINEGIMQEIEVPFTSLYEWLDTCTVSSSSPLFTEFDATCFPASLPRLYIFNVTPFYPIFSMTTGGIKMRVFMQFEGLEFNFPRIMQLVTPTTGHEGDACSGIPGEDMDFSAAHPQGGWSMANAVRAGVTGVAGTTAVTMASRIIQSSDKKHQTVMETLFANGGVTTDPTSSESPIEQVRIAQAELQEAICQQDHQANINPFVPNFQMTNSGLKMSVMAKGDIPLSSADVTGEGLHMIKKLCMLPSIYRIDRLYSGNPFDYTYFYVQPNQTSPGSINGEIQTGLGYFRWFTQMFKMWRASLNIMIVFFGAATVTSRVRITLGHVSSGMSTPSAVTMVPALNPTWEIVIKGTVTWKTQIPWMYYTDWMTTFNTSTRPQTSSSPILTMTLVNSQSPGDVAIAIPYIMWMAPAEDLAFRFANPMSANAVVPMNREGYAMSSGISPWRDFTGFEPHPGVCSGMKSRKHELPVTTCEEYLRRYTLYEAGSSTTLIGSTLVPYVPSVEPYAGTTLSGTASVLQYIGQLFMWFSGDQDFQVTGRKINLAPTEAPTGDIGSNFVGDIATAGWGQYVNTGTATGYNNAMYPDGGVSLMNMDSWTVGNYTVPFLSVNAYAPTQAMSAWYNRRQTSSMNTLESQEVFYYTINSLGEDSDAGAPGSSIFNVYVRAGKSFQIFGLLPLPSWKFWMLNTNLSAPPMVEEHLLEMRRLRSHAINPRSLYTSEERVYIYKIMSRDLASSKNGKQKAKSLTVTTFK